MATPNAFTPTETEPTEPTATDTQAVEGLMNEMFGKAGATETPPAATTPAAEAGNDLGESSTPPAAIPEAPAPEAGKGLEGVKVETPAAPAAPAPEAKTELPLGQQAQPAAVQADPELDALVMPRGMNPKNQENWNNLREINKARGQKIKAFDAEMATRDQKIQELEQKLTSVPDTKEVEDLRQFQRMFNIRNDPQFKAKFEDGLAKSDNELYELLQWRGMTKEHTEAMKKVGIDSYPRNWWKENVLQTLVDSEDPNDNRAAALIEAKLNQRDTLVWDKEKAIKEASDSGSAYVKEQMEKQKFNSEYETKVITDRVGQLQKDIPWLKVQPVPAGATPEQKAQIERSNQFYKETEQRFLTAIYPTTPEAKVETAVAACLAFKLADDLSSAQGQLKAVMTENEKLKNVGRTAAAGRATVVAPTKAQNAMSKLRMKDEDAVMATFKEMGI